MCSKWVRKSKRASEKWTKSSAALDCRSRRRTTPRNNCARKPKRSTSSVRAKTWSALRKHSPQPNKKNIAPANLRRQKRNQPRLSASRRKTRRRNRVQGTVRVREQLKVWCQRRIALQDSKRKCQLGPKAASST